MTIGAAPWTTPPVSEAVIVDDTVAVADWLDRGVPADLKDRHYNTPLWASVAYSSLRVFPLLLDHGADVGWRDADGLTLLHVAGEQPLPSFVPVLVDLDIDVNVRGGKKERTPLMLAAEGGHLEVVVALLEAGAKIGLEEGGVAKRHYTALVFAAGGGHREIVEVLARDDKEVKKHGGLTLQAAASGGYIDIVEFLLERGADPNKSGKPSALDVATRKGHWEIALLLMDHGAEK